MKKRFACTKCHFSSDNRNVLKGYCVTHTGVKAYKCYSTQGNLTQHINSIHTKENEYKCDICKKVYYRRRDYFDMLKEFMTKLNHLFVLYVIEHFLKEVISQDI